MTDRGAEDRPLAPPRSLSAPAGRAGARESAPGAGGAGPEPAGRGGEDDTTARRPLSERVSAAVSAAGSAVQQAASSGPRPTQQGTSVTRPEPAAPHRPAGRPRGPRRARLRLVHLDPWSVMKTSFLLSIAFGIVTVVSVGVVWSVLGAAGVWDSINATVTDVLGSESATGFDIEDYVGAERVLGFTMLVAVVDVVLITAIATLGAFLYNLAAALLGGLEVTLAEDER